MNGEGRSQRTQMVKGGGGQGALKKVFKFGVSVMQFPGKLGFFRARFAIGYYINLWTQGVRRGQLNFRQ